MLKPKVKKTAANVAGKKAVQKISPMSPDSDIANKTLEPAADSSAAETAVGGSNGHPIKTENSEPASTGAQTALEPIKSQSGADLTEKIKELLRLAQEQGYLTYNDINDTLKDKVLSADEFDDIFIKLRNLEVEIVDQAEVDRV